MNHQDDVVDTYRTRDGLVHFTFRFVPSGSRYEVDVLDTPPYDLFEYRNTDQHVTHRIDSDRGGDQICFGNPHSIQTLQDCRKWARTWAENTWYYIRTGIEMANTE